jgi:hypothetical protein
VLKRYGSCPYAVLAGAVCRLPNAFAIIAPDGVKRIVSMAAVNPVPSEKRQTPTSKRILVAVDPSAASRRALSYVVELASAIAWENYRARFNRAFDVTAEGFAEGSACAVPARVGSGAGR